MCTKPSSNYTCYVATQIVSNILQTKRQSKIYFEKTRNLNFFSDFLIGIFHETIHCLASLFPSHVSEENQTNETNSGGVVVLWALEKIIVSTISYLDKLTLKPYYELFLPSLSLSPSIFSSLSLLSLTQLNLKTSWNLQQLLICGKWRLRVNKLYFLINFRSKL